MISTIFRETVMNKDVALLCMRVGIGIIFMRHGFPKIMGGTKEWLWLGGAMAYFGITFAPLMWGLMAALAEGVGGLCLTIGFGTRIASFFLACTMFVATVMHIAKGDSWGYISHPLSLLIIFIGFMIAGSGPYSVDALIRTWFL